MPDTKISDLAELTSLAATDEFVVVDKSDTAMAASGTNKRVKKSTLDAEASLVALAPSTSARNVVQPTGAAVVPFTVRGAASQTANLQEWQDSAGVFSFVDKGGRLVLNADQDAPLDRGTLTLMNRTPDDPPSAKRPGINFVHKAADGEETWDWHWGEDVASDPPDLALYHRESGSDFLYFTNETPEPRMGVNTGTWDAPPPGTLSVVSRTDDRPAFTAVTADADQTGWIMKWGWGTGEWLGGIDSQTAGLALGQASAALALIHLDTGTTANKGIRFGDDATALALYRSSESKLRLEGGQEIVSDGAALEVPLTLRNSVMTAAGQGVSTRYELGRVTAAELAGWIDVIAEQTWTADPTTHDAAMTFATGLDAVAAEKMRLTATGRLGIGNPSPRALLHVGAGLDNPIASSTAVVSHTGTTVLTVRDSTNDAEVNLHASSDGGLFGTSTAHALAFKTSDVERMRLNAGGGLRVIDDIELEGALNHDGATVGFYAAAPVAQETGWGDPLATESALRTPLTTASTLDDTRRYVKTLAKAIRNLGLIGA